MNRLHHWLCDSARWRETIEQRVPWALAGADLGQNVLELGPGPGLTTDLLRPTVRRLTAIEVDPRLSQSLSLRLRGSNVAVVTGDATAMPLSDARFSGVVSFTMLHHVPPLDCRTDCFARYGGSWSREEFSWPVTAYKASSCG